MARSLGAVTAGLILALSSHAEARTPKKPPPPITFSRPAPVVQSPRETYGDWAVTTAGKAAYMATTFNSAGAGFGTICDETGCQAFFDTQIGCEEGANYPALINAPAAAYPVVLSCQKVGTLSLYSLPLEGAIADAMSVGGVLGVAFPMASGEFKVSRFSLTGAARASARAAQLGKGDQGNARQNARDSLTL